MPHSRELLLGIRKRAFILYTQEGVPTPENYDKASIELGIPNDRDALLEVRVEIKELENKKVKAPEPPKPKRNRKKHARVTPSEPPPINWQGTVILRGNTVDLGSLHTAQDWKSAAAHDTD